MVRAPFFKSSNGNYVITHGFRKKSQNMPKSELDKALKRKKRYEEKYGVR
ncbi:type II toxin-antitoxin system RelE/ParE family toxin [uncultured Lactobacillus sp.]|nr:type II toxin-antitoxin system RelE/ParE family toxin [uncultured Lactobacillus sp.]